MIPYLVFFTWRYLEGHPPFYRQIKQEELWLYKNPVAKHDAVPTLTLYVRESKLVRLVWPVGWRLDQSDQLRLMYVDRAVYWAGVL